MDDRSKSMARRRREPDDTLDTTAPVHKLNLCVDERPSSACNPPYRSLARDASLPLRHPIACPIQNQPQHREYTALVFYWRKKTEKWVSSF
ncbi:MAG: hypothetical protein ABI411_17210, partial [Tahibacter sp.]